MQGNHPISPTKNSSPSDRKPTKAAAFDLGCKPKLNSQSPKSKSKKFSFPGKRSAKRFQSQPMITASESKCSDAKSATTRIEVASSRHLLSSDRASSFLIKRPPFNPQFAPKSVIPPFALALMRELKREVKARERKSRILQNWLKKP